MRTIIDITNTNDIQKTGDFIILKKFTIFIKYNLFYFVK